MGGAGYFVGNEIGVVSGALFRTDGTPEGTTLVKDINPGPGSGEPANLLNMNGQSAPICS